MTKKFVAIVEKKERYNIDVLELESIEEYETVNTNPDIIEYFTISKKDINEYHTLNDELEIRLDKKMKDIKIVEFKKEGF